MQLSDFDYDLPPGLIAQHPLPDRDASRLLVLERASGAIRHLHFRDILELIPPSDLLVSFSQPNSPFAIISTGRFLRRGNQYAIPLSALSPLDTGALAADADNATLQRAPSFSPQVWEAANANDKVYQYPKTGD